MVAATFTVAPFRQAGRVRGRRRRPAGKGLVMNRLTRDEVRLLAEHRHPASVSLFMPTHRAGPQVRQDPIRLKNLLRETEDALRSREVGDADAKATLLPIRALLEDREFWRNQGNGLAVLATPEEHHVYRLPITLEQLAVVGDRYQLKPLLPMLARGGRYYLLALSRQRVRLFEATRDTMREMDTGDIPASLADAVGYDWEQRSLQFHTSTPMGDGQRSAEFFGHGAGQDDSGPEDERFLRLVDDGVRTLVADDSAPLVLAAVAELFGEYRKLSRYPKLAEKFVTGNPDHMDEAELLERAWKVAAPPLAEERRHAADSIRERQSGDRVLQLLEDIVVAAADGRIETLFVTEGARRWGRFDDAGRTVTVHDAAEPMDEDLVNRAAVETLARDGSVHIVPAAEMPVRDSQVAAALRF